MFVVAEWGCIALHVTGRGSCDPYTPMVFWMDMQRLPRRPPPKSRQWLGAGTLGHGGSRTRTAVMPGAWATQRGPFAWRPGGIASLRCPALSGHSRGSLVGNLS